MKRSRRRCRFSSGAETEGSKGALEDYPQCSDPNLGCQLLRKESKPYRQAQKSPGQAGAKVDSIALKSSVATISRDDQSRRPPPLSTMIRRRMKMNRLM